MQQVCDTTQPVSVHLLQNVYRRSLRRLLLSESFCIARAHRDSDLLVQSPHAYRIRNIELYDVTPVNVDDHRNLDTVLAPVDHLAADCDKLETVLVPAEVTLAQHRPLIFYPESVSLSLQIAKLSQRRYPFELFLENKLTERI